MSGWFELKKNASGKYHFVLKAGNSETILSSEVYETKASAEKGIASVQTNSQLDERFEQKVAKDGSFYFVLKAANHQVIGNSEMYKTEESCKKGIASVKQNGKVTTVKEI